MVDMEGIVDMAGMQLTRPLPIINLPLSFRRHRGVAGGTGTMADSWGISEGALELEV
jgi:hypothetical protein